MHHIISLNILENRVNSQNESIARTYYLMAAHGIPRLFDLLVCYSNMKILRLTTYY
jgi:hypothetical protein